MATRPEIRYFDDYVKETGWGLYNNFLVGLACSCNFIQAATYMAIPLAVALSTCNENFIPEQIILRIFTSFYLGSGIGGLIANFLSDRYGRKRYISYSLMFIFMSTFTAAFAYNSYIIIGASIFVGVGLETNILAIKLLMIEILPKERRGTYMVFCNIFWTLGYIFTTALIIFLETPLLSDTAKLPDPNLASWRVLFAIVGGLNILLACACALIEESPRYFLQMGRSYLAYLVLKQLFAINNSDFAENFKVKEEEIKHLIPQYGLFYLEPEPYWDILKKLTWRFLRSLKFMFSDRFFKTTWVLILLKIPVLVVGVLQLNTVLAKILTYNALSKHSVEYKGLDFVYPVFKPLTYMSLEEFNRSTSICDGNDDNRSFFKNFLILGSAMTTGIIFAMLMVDWLGRKFTLFTGLLFSGWSFLTLRFIKGNIIQLVLSCVIMASISSITSIASLVTLEAYPTAFRGTAYGVTNFLGLILAVLFINFIVIESHILISIMGVLCLCGRTGMDMARSSTLRAATGHNVAAVARGLSVSTTFLPELRRKPMTE